jgi:hypothetical protein
MSERRPLFARFFLPLLAVAALLLTALFVVEFAAPARALPSYARQTGQPCGTCHTDFAGLTPYGRRFKIGGYTAGGGQYRTTLFPFDDSTRDSQKKWVPPISMMSVVGFTHTKAEASPPTDPFAPNDNVTITPLSFFWGGGQSVLTPVHVGCREKHRRPVSAESCVVFCELAAARRQ